MIESLRDVSVLSFDCYGTLIDWEAGIWQALQPLLAAGGGTPVDRDVALRCFARLESELQSSAPALAYPLVLEGVHAALAEMLGLESTPELDRAFGESIGSWPAFPDTAAALEELSHRFRLVILSNVDRASFAASNRRLGVTFDAVLTAEEIGSYKPDARNFEYLTTHLDKQFGVGADGLLHVAQSVYHDLVPAKAVGLSTCWIDRQGLASGDGSFGATRPVEEMPDIDHVFPTLGEFAAALRAPPAG